MNIRFYIPALALAGLAVATVPGVALAQSQAPAQASETQATGGDSAEAEEPKTKRVCTMEKTTGSNFPRKVCRTVSENEVSPKGQGAVDELRQRQESRQLYQGTNP